MKVISVNIGKKKKVTWKNKTYVTGIYKYPVEGPIFLGKEDVVNDTVIDRKLKTAIKKGFIRAEDEENIRKLCQTVITEYLHTPSKQLKDISRNMECDIVVGTIQNMFGLSTDSSLSSKYKCEHLIKN